MTDRDPLDDAIDRAVRDMTHVAADDEAVAVARVMARLRESNARERRTFAPRLAWAGAAAALLLIAIIASYLLRSSHPDRSAPVVAVKVAPPSTASSPPSTSSPSTTSSSQQAHATREIPTPAMHPSSIPQATTAEPLESDITIASITPAPLGDAPAIYVEPLITPSLQVDEIPLPSIEMPPVSPERQK